MLGMAGSPPPEPAVGAALTFHPPDPSEAKVTV
jgi:hypothetical protein